MLAHVPVLVAQNVVIIASVALNGLSAYLLAYTVTRNRWPSILAGTLFLLAPSLAGRLMGHFNLLVAWPLVLACTAFFEAARGLLPVTVLAALVASPILMTGTQLLMSGDYVTQTATLKSSGGGVDVATLLLGPPYHGVIGERVQGWYKALQIDPIESSAWLGVVLPALLMATPRRQWREPDLRCWLCVAGVFTLWALGPYLMVLGSNTGLILPEALSRLVPIVNNARILGRAMVMVELSLVVLTALVSAGWLTRRRFLFAAILGLGMLERLAAPVPLVTVPEIGVYKELARDASPELLSFVDDKMPLKYVSEDSLRMLFEVADDCSEGR